jgi:hypothetical protein
MSGLENNSINPFMFRIQKAHTEPYEYVKQFIEYSLPEDVSSFYWDLDKKKGKQIVHRASLLNSFSADWKNMDESLKSIPSEFFTTLQRFAEGFKEEEDHRRGVVLRNHMIKLLDAYADFKEKNRRESVFIMDLYKELPKYFYPNAPIGDMTGGKAAVKTSEGHKFTVNSTRKKWTHSKKYKKWLGKLTRKQKPNKKEEDLCVGKGSICKGDLGIPRKYMPQFNSPEEIKSFTKFVKRAYRIKSFKGTRKANTLKPSQGEINKKRINGLIKEGVLEKVNIPLVISGDDYVVDGHHRWAAYRLKKPEAKLPVVVIDAPVKDILGIAVAWGAKHQEF